MMKRIGWIGVLVAAVFLVSGFVGLSAETASAQK